MYLKYAVLTTINKLNVESIFLLHEFNEIKRIQYFYCSALCVDHKFLYGYKIVNASVLYVL